MACVCRIFCAEPASTSAENALAAASWFRNRVPGYGREMGARPESELKPEADRQIPDNVSERIQSRRRGNCANQASDFRRRVR